MQENTLRQKWRAGQPTINGWLSIANGFVAEIMAAQGYDSLTVDMQHGAIGYQAGLGMLQAMRASGVTPLARVPWLAPGDIMKAMDAGAMGIICPMVNTADQASELASYCRYPPLGTRSFGPTRALFAHGSDYAAHANDQMLVIAMIETAQGVANVDAICATPGIDGIYIGPADLTLGVTNGRLPPGMDREEPEMVATIKTILKAAKDAGRAACIHTGAPEYAAKAIGWGFDLVTVGSDVKNMATATAQSIATFRGLVGQDGSGGQQPGY